MERLKAEAGFTLVEFLIVAMIMASAMAAVVAIYQVTQRSALFASAGQDAQRSARAILDRLATELRLINAGRGAATGAITAASAASITFLGDIDSDTVAFNPATGTWTEATLTTAPQADAGATKVQVSSATGFAVGEQLSVADGPISETQPITAIAGTTLTLGAGLSTYYPAGSILRSVETVSYTYTPGATGGTLTRTVRGLADILANNVTAFTLTYWDGAVPPLQITDAQLAGSQANRDLVREIRVQITVRSQMDDQPVSRTMQATVRPRNF